MKVVGITGGIGSGKTTVCTIFELLDIPVFYADDEAKKLYDDVKIKSKVVKLFGKNVIEKNGKIDKTKLAEIVFSDKLSLAKLNAIIHSEVRKKFSEWKKKKQNKKYVIKEAAIMIESGAYKELDYLISVNSPEYLRIRRILYKNNMDIKDINKRMKEQISDKEREKYADAVIINDDKHSLIEQVIKIHHELIS